MRTTITLEPDVAERIRKDCLSKKLSQKAIINEALRRGLSNSKEDRKVKPFRVRPIRSAFRSGVDFGKLNQVLDDLEVEAFSRGKQ